MPGYSIEKRDAYLGIRFLIAIPTLPCTLTGGGVFKRDRLSFPVLGATNATRAVHGAHVPFGVVPVRPREGHFAPQCLIPLPHALVRHDYDSRYI